MNNKRLLIFTDLDGTLLDHNNYSTEPARAALSLIKQHNIPLIFNTSKTRAEILRLRKELNNTHPFGSENGSCVCIPDGYFHGEPQDTLHTTIFGALYSNIKQQLTSIRAEHNFRFTGFSDMGISAIAEHTGLSAEQARCASERDCSEPLIWQDSDENLITFERLLNARDLSLTRGGRFHHVSGGGDKGLTVNWLREIYESEYPDTTFITVGLGDGQNDIPMLEAVDCPILVRAEHGAPPNTTHIPDIVKTEVPGPNGWNTEIVKIIREYYPSA